MHGHASCLIGSDTVTLEITATKEMITCSQRKMSSLYDIEGLCVKHPSVSTDGWPQPTPAPTPPQSGQLFPSTFIFLFLAFLCSWIYCLFPYYYGAILGISRHSQVGFGQRLIVTFILIFLWILSKSFQDILDIINNFHNYMSVYLLELSNQLYSLSHYNFILVHAEIICFEPY